MWCCCHPLSMTSNMMTRTAYRKNIRRRAIIVFFSALSLATTTMVTKGQTKKKKKKKGQTRTELNWKRERYECVGVWTMRLHGSSRVESSQLNSTKGKIAKGRATKAKATENGVLPFSLFFLFFFFSHSLLSLLDTFYFIFLFLLFSSLLPTLFHFLISFHLISFSLPLSPSPFTHSKTHRNPPTNRTNGPTDRQTTARQGQTLTFLLT